MTMNSKITYPDALIKRCSGGEIRYPLRRATESELEALRRANEEASHSRVGRVWRALRRALRLSRNS